MSMTQQEIGRRLANWRKRKGYSQEELASKVEMNRGSLAQIETGNRNLDARELHAFAQILGFSLDEFMSDSTESDADTIVEKAVIIVERVAKAPLDVKKFRHVLLYLLERCAGKPNVGETVLYKLLYFAEFDHYERYEELMTGATYRKLKFGPVPFKVDRLIEKMLEDGQLQRITSTFKGKEQKRLIAQESADLSLLKASEKDIIDRVIERFGDWTATALSDYSHGDMPWKAAEDGKEISYELVFYRDAPYSVRTYPEDDAT